MALIEIPGQFAGEKRCSVNTLTTAIFQIRETCKRPPYDRNEDSESKASRNTSECLPIKAPLDSSTARVALAAASLRSCKLMSR